MIPLWGLVLAGGASRRMGQDKAALVYGGRPQLARAFGLVSPRTERSFVSLRPDQGDDPLRSGWPGITDMTGADGPAAGILAAHDAYPDVAWLVLACDLPFLDEDSLDALIGARAAGCSAIAFRSEHDGVPEPLCTIWEPEALARLRLQMAGGGGSLRRVLAAADVCVLSPRTPGALDNINTPEERAEAVMRLADGG
ncbi:NTP transferase domain-containing protein [Acetobacter sp. AN02]|uniref:NTP transferase domain-containing protein n=1 Tax=Acetobacter sp. AN02 TaxID=2894186 RepID=UPI00243459BF|nr:NTP transferase domain-containing protein [Acetobacter sp. AN02]MDG6093874.1 NTP transferase domain-containing protein [Acetobacter sp. AN02]